MIETSTTKTLAELVGDRTVTAGDIADSAKVTPSTLSNWCNGKRRPDPEPAARLAAVLGVTLDDLYAAYDRGVAAREAEAARKAAGKDGGQ